MRWIFFFNNYCFKFFFKIFAIKSTRGVLPVPPKYILPMHIVLMLEYFFGLIKIVINFLKSKI